MKKQLLYTLLFLIPICLQAQVISDFENNTTYNWTNVDGSTTMLTYETHPTGVPSNLGIQYIQKSCDGTNTALGEMAFKTELNGVNMYINTPWGIGFSFYVKNENSFPLYLRFGMKGTNEAEIVTNEPYIVPAFTDWTFGFIWSGTDESQDNFGNFHVVDEGNYVPPSFPTSDPYFLIQGETLRSLAELRIIHNQTASFEGEIVTGTLQIDNLRAIFPLSVDEKSLRDVKIFPNPVSDQLFINFPHKTKGTLTLTSVDGRQLLTKELNAEQMQLDLSSIKSKGIYFLKIKTSEGTLTKKVVKA